MSRKTSQKRIEANRRNAQKSTGPRTSEGKAKSAQNATNHGLSSLNRNPLGPGCFLQIEDQNQFQITPNGYVEAYRPQQRDELDLFTEAVLAKWRQQRLWVADTAQIEVAIAKNERDLLNCTSPCRVRVPESAASTLRCGSNLKFRRVAATKPLARPPTD